MERDGGCDPRQSTLHVAKGGDQTAQPVRGGIEAQRGAVRRLHRRASQQERPRCYRCTRWNHLPAPERRVRSAQRSVERRDGKARVREGGRRWLAERRKNKESYKK